MIQIHFFVTRKSTNTTLFKCLKMYTTQTSRTFLSFGFHIILFPINLKKKNLFWFLRIDSQCLSFNFGLCPQWDSLKVVSIFKLVSDHKKKSENFSTTLWPPIGRRIVPLVSQVAYDILRFRWLNNTYYNAIKNVIFKNFTCNISNTNFPLPLCVSEGIQKVPIFAQLTKMIYINDPQFLYKKKTNFSF